MKIDGKKFPCGKYILERSMSILISKRPQPKYILVIKESETLVYEGEKNITDEIRRLDFKKTVVFLWRKPSKVGLPFTADYDCGI